MEGWGFFEFSVASRFWTVDAFEAGGLENVWDYDCHFSSGVDWNLLKVVFVEAMSWAFCQVLGVLHSAMVDACEMAGEVDASDCGYVLLPWGLVIYFCNVSHQTYFWIDLCSLI